VLKASLVTDCATAQLHAAPGMSDQVSDFGDAPRTALSFCFCFLDKDRRR